MHLKFDFEFQFWQTEIAMATTMKTNHTPNCIESRIKSAAKSPNSWATIWCTMRALSFHRWFLRSLVFDRAKPICPHTFYHFKWCYHSIRLASRVGASNGSFNWMLVFRMRCAWSLRLITSFFIATISWRFAFIFNYWWTQFETMLSKSSRNTNDNRATGHHGRKFEKNWPIPLPFTINQLSIKFNQFSLPLSSFSNFPFSFFHARIFDLVADINSCIIFSLLPANSIALGLSMYRNEHVNIEWFLNFIKTFWDNSWSRECFDTVCHRSGRYRIWFAVLHLLTHLALFILLLCKYHVRTNAIDWRRCLQSELV